MSYDYEGVTVDVRVLRTNAKVTCEYFYIASNQKCGHKAFALINMDPRCRDHLIPTLTRLADDD